MGDRMDWWVARIAYFVVFAAVIIDIFLDHRVRGEIFQSYFWLFIGCTTTYYCYRQLTRGKM